MARRLARMVAWWAIALVGLGGGGANIINTVMQRNQTRLVAAQFETLKQALREVYEEQER